MATTYNSIDDYYKCDDDLKAKIKRIDVILEGLYKAAEDYATNSHVEEYRWDDGQTIIRTIYRSMSDIRKSIKDFIELRNLLINRNCIGNAVRFRDQDSYLINR